MAHIQAVIFDLDGTLLDTLDDLADAANTALAEEGFSAHESDAYRFFVGDGMETLMRRAAPQADAETLVRLHERMRAVYGEHWADKTRPYDGIIPMLEGLHRKGLALAVLSNKPDEFTRLCVSRYFDDGLFQRVQGSPKGGKAKPDPSLALETAASLGARPDAVLFVGDSCVDMTTATAAGMLPCGVLWGFRPKSELLEHGAKLLLDKPDDVFRHV